MCFSVVLGGAAHAQTGAPNATGQSDVIYGRKAGMALTMEVMVIEPCRWSSRCGSPSA